MADLFGRAMSKREVLDRVGDVSQLARCEEFRYSAGRAENMRGVAVSTGAGLSFAVLPSRGLDIAWAEYRGVPLAFVSKSGLAGPWFYEPEGLGFLRGFTCGLLTTCGLSHMGAPCRDGDEELGLHGRVSHIPASGVYARAAWNGDDYEICVGGVVRESRMFGENLVLTREIRTKLGSSSITIHDRVENEGADPAPLMLLYHINFGYPLLDEGSRLRVDTGPVRGRDARADEGLAEWDRFDAPQPGFAEQVFYLDPLSGPEGVVQATLHNPGLLGGLSAWVRYDTRQLPHLSEWKMTGPGDYVLGIEPGTWVPEGRAEARRRGELRFLQPGECAEFQVEIGVAAARDA